MADAQKPTGGEKPRFSPPPLLIRWRMWSGVLISALFAWVLYLRTLAPDVFVSDFAEFQYQPILLGLPHPNGFPFYMLLGWAWSHIPLGNIAWRMNLLSAVGGALGVAVMAAFAQRVSGRASVGMLAGVLLALSPTYWGYSLVAERYTLNLALLILPMWLAWELAHLPEAEVRSSLRECTGGSRACRLLFLAALSLGLGLAVHPSDVLLIPFWAAYLWWRVPTLRRPSRAWVYALVAGALPQLLYAYVPWRWAAYADWPLLPGIERSAAVYQGLVHVWYEPPLRWDMVVYYITGLGGYATGLLAGGWRQAFALLSVLWPVWKAEIPWWVAVAALWGGVRLFRRDGALAVVLAAFAAFLTLMVAYIQQGKNEAYLLPAFWVVLLAAAFALDVPTPRRRGLPPAVRVGVRGVRVGIVLVVALILLVGQYRERDLSRRLDIRWWWEDTLNVPIEQGAGLLGHWSDFTPLWYLQHIDGQRPDLYGLFPPDVENVIQPWLDTGAALYQAAPTHGWAPDLPQRYTLIPWGNLIRILPRGAEMSLDACRAQLRGDDATQRVFDFPALTLVVEPLPDALDPARGDALRVCWQAKADLPRDTYLGLRLAPTWDGRGEDIHARLAIHWYPHDTLAQGTVGMAVIPLRLPLGTVPGTYRATLYAFQLPQGGGASPLPGVGEMDLGEVQISPAREFVRARLPQGTVPPVAPRGGPLVLRGWSLSQQAVRPGDPIRLTLWWEVRERPQAAPAVQVYFWGKGAHNPLTRPQPLLPGAPPDVWQPGTILRTEHTIYTPRGVGDTTYLAELRLRIGERQVAWFPTWRLPLGRVSVRDRHHRWEPPWEATPVQATFGSAFELVGYRLKPEGPRAGQPFSVILYWRSLQEVDTSYKVFVHLVDAAGNIVAQHDAFPANNTLPTNIWVAGEYIEDVHVLEVSPDVPPGTYRVRVGLYDPNTWARLPVHSSLPVQDNALDLLELTLR